MGNRVQKYVNATSETINMLYDRGDCLADYDDNDNLLRYYITPFMDENMVLTDASSGTPSMDLFYAQDGLGTVRQIFNANSVLVNNYDYEGFGTETSTTGALYNRYRFTGREYDAETEWDVSVGTMNYSFNGTYYYRARTYDTTIGSFTSRDPIPYANLYPYCSANPINFTDPKGESGGINSTTFYSCEKCAKDYIECMLKKLLEAVDKASKAILITKEEAKLSNKYFNKHYGKAVSYLNDKYSFFETENFDRTNEDHINALYKIRSNFYAIEDFLRYGDVEISCYSSKTWKAMIPDYPNASGVMRTLSNGDRFIALNMAYFCKKLTNYTDYMLQGNSRERFLAQTLVHELSHQAANTVDTRHIGHGWRRNTDGELERYEMTESIYNGDKNYKKMDYTERIKHADTNANFIMNYYDAKPKCKLDKDCCTTMGESTK